MYKRAITSLIEHLNLINSEFQIRNTSYNLKNQNKVPRVLSGLFFHKLEMSKLGLFVYDSEIFSSLCGSQIKAPPQSVPLKFSFRGKCCTSA